jgi:SAM-dependent methyltransferase
METPRLKRRDTELEYQARQARTLADIQPIRHETIRRYRECRGARLHRKDYTFSLIHKIDPRTILDFGCGDGVCSLQLAHCGYRVTGFDVSPELIAVARQRAKLENLGDRVVFFEAAGEDLALTNQFDAALVQLVLHHVLIRPCLESLTRMLKPRGWVIIVEPVGYCRWLQWLRDRVPIEKDISPNERQLNKADLAVIEEFFEFVECRHFRLLSRLDRILPQWIGPLRWFIGRVLLAVDFAILKIPGAHRFAGTIVILGRLRPASHESR